MMRSMFASVVGLKVHQTRMDVIGNNVANVNTVGFKAGRVTFQDLFSQTLRGASAPTNETGGTNPMQVGLGSALGSIDTLMTPGTLQLTGRETDMAIEGNGFFVLGLGGQRFYTRAGSFSRDSLGYLVNAQNGMRAQGWMARADGTFPTKDSSTLQDIQIPTGAIVQASPTTYTRFAQTLDAKAPVGTEVVKSTKVFDSQGQVHEITFKFQKTGINQWDVGVFDPAGTELAASQTGTLNGVAGAVFPGSAGGPYATSNLQLQFNADGTIKETAAGTPLYASFTYDPLNGASPINIVMDFSKVDQSAVEEGGTSSIQVEDRDGYPMGALDSFSIDSRGVVSGVFTNGQRRALAQVALAVFPNPEGLTKVGGNAFVTSTNSGLEQIGEPGTGGRGTIAPSNLEMSNVDLSSEFTNMIVTQRGFQANSRVITVTDEMLQDLVNLKR